MQCYFELVGFVVLELHIIELEIVLFLLIENASLLVNVVTEPLTVK